MALSAAPAEATAAPPAMSLRWARIGVAAVVGVTAVLGVWHPLAPGAAPATTNLDAEHALPAYVSGALLFAAAAAAVLLARRIVWWACLALGGLFAFMGLDEMLSWHEYLEWRLQTDWQVLYAPVVAAGAVAWAVLVRRLRADGLPLLGLILGAVAWGASQVLEALQWDGDIQRPGYTAMMVVEEIAEMVGSAAFALGMIAVLVVLHRTRDRAEVPTPATGDSAR